MNPNPTCELECRFTHGMSMSTMMYYPPVYDKNGFNINPDMNTTFTPIECGVCNRKWNASTRCGQTTYEESHYECK